MYHSSHMHWHCEKCNADLSTQKNFKDFDPYYDDYYECQKCGYINDFSDDDETVSEEELERQKNEERMDRLNIVDLFLD